MTEERVKVVLGPNKMKFVEFIKDLFKYCVALFSLAGILMLSWNWVFVPELCIGQECTNIFVWLVPVFFLFAALRFSNTLWFLFLSWSYIFLYSSLLYGYLFILKYLIL